MPSIAFVGAGPTTLYALNALVAHGAEGVTIVVFEAQQTAGAGSPYRPGWNDPAMLSNIASAEIPPLTETLLGWLQSLPFAELEAMGVQTKDLHDRAFVPRVALGRFFESQLDALVAVGRARGIKIDVRTAHRVVDAVNRADGMELSVLSLAHGETIRELFDHVVIATGHQWSSQQEARPGYFTSPWPADTLSNVGPTSVGVRGSSLTAIDTVVALALTHGAFVRVDGHLFYKPADGADGLSITMMSRKGLLPEADFYFPLPHAPLQVCTEAAVASLVERGAEGLLDAVFDLFARELQTVDPRYAQAHDLSGTTPERFGESYFSARARVDPFEWAALNLTEARETHARATTIAWRDAILRMHEVVGWVAPYLDAVDFRRFNEHLKPIFVDVYAAVPHESVERLLALHQAGKLRVIALGTDYEIDTRCANGGARLIKDVVQHFPVFIEATGQRPLTAIEFPFLSLLEQGIVRDTPSAAQAGAPRGIAIDNTFQPVAIGLPQDRLFCLSLPFILGRHPFVQGITSSHQMGEAVGHRLAQVVACADPSFDALPAVA